MALFILLAAFLTASRFYTVSAQVSSVVCVPGWEWTYNTHLQSPCLVAAYLLGNCIGGQFTVNPLGVGRDYVGPTKDIQNQCWCSTVAYSLFSACGACQNSTWISWSEWDTNCTVVYPEIYSLDIPEGTAVPGWAYQVVTVSDAWNPAIARADAASPESTGTGSHSTYVPSTATTASPSQATTRAPSSRKKTPVGALAGGVAGGILGLGLLISVAFFLMRRKRTSAVPSVTDPTHTPPTKAYSPPPVGQYQNSFNTSAVPSLTTTSTPPYDQNPNNYSGAPVNVMPFANPPPPGQYVQNSTGYDVMSGIPPSSGGYGQNPTGYNMPSANTLPSVPSSPGGPGLNFTGYNMPPASTLPSAVRPPSSGGPGQNPIGHNMPPVNTMPAAVRPPSGGNAQDPYGYHMPPANAMSSAARPPSSGGPVQNQNYSRVSMQPLPAPRLYNPDDPSTFPEGLSTPPNYTPTPIGTPPTSNRPVS